MLIAWMLRLLVTLVAFPDPDTLKGLIGRPSMFYGMNVPHESSGENQWTSTG